MLNGDDDMLASVGQVKGRKPVTYGISCARPEAGAAGSCDVYAGISG